MPTYDYLCSRCKHRFELFHSIKDESPKRCPKCKARSRRVPAGGAGLLFKGSGFYITDYRSHSYQKAAKKDRESSSPKKGSGGDGKKSSGGKDTSG
jgi:putative FmdB family regulatory protein